MPNYTKPSIVVFRQVVIMFKTCSVDAGINIGKSLQSGRHPQCVLALILNKQEIDTQSTAISHQTNGLKHAQQH